MSASVQSRLWGSAATFAASLGIASYGLWWITGPDQWLWLVTAAVLLVTAVVGVMFADSDSAFSVWLTLGGELLAVFTLLPLGWMFSLARGASTPNSLWPHDGSWDNFAEVLDSSAFRRAVENSLLIAGASTLIAVLLAAAAAYAIVHRVVRGRRWLYAVVLAALFLPVFAAAGPMTTLALQWGVADRRAALVVAYLALTLPLAMWLFVSLFSQVPWALREAARADGATGLQLLRRVDVPLLGSGVVTITLLVFFVACNDLVLGLALGSTTSSMPLAATIASFGPGFADPSAATAAAGLLWLAPIVLFVLVFQRNIAWLVGRPNR